MNNAMSQGGSQGALRRHSRRILRTILALAAVPLIVESMFYGHPDNGFTIVAVISVLVYIPLGAMAIAYRVDRWQVRQLLEQVDRAKSPSCDASTVIGEEETGVFESLPGSVIKCIMFGAVFFLAWFAGMCAGALAHVRIGTGTVGTAVGTYAIAYLVWYIFHRFGRSHNKYLLKEVGIDWAPPPRLKSVYRVLDVSAIVAGILVLYGALRVLCWPV